MKFEAKTLEEVYTKASDYFGKSISELDFTIIQNPTKGIFGFLSKPAIIEIIEPIQIEEIENNKSETTQESTPPTIEKISNDDKNIEKSKNEKTIDFEVKELSINDVANLVKQEINELFELSCFEVEKIEVKVYDDETLMFEINGEDSALLIGKEGYRYNALASMIFNWISQKYGYKTRLEIASFLESQEEMMRKFLEPVIREIEEKGRVKTKPFDGVLAYIAVEILRSEFPHKYVAIKRNRDDSQYIIVNDFLNKNNG